MAMVIWYMCSGFPPFRTASPEQLGQGFIHRTQQREQLTTAVVPNAALTKIIETAWAEDPNERPTAADVRASLEQIKAPRMTWPSAGSFQLKNLTKWRSAACDKR